MIPIDGLQPGPVDVYPMPAHLHVHSNFSFLEGLGSPADLARLAARWQMPALALTDHLGLSGAIEFYDACRQEGIQPVIKDAAGLFGEPAILGYKKGNRAARFIKPGKALPQPEWLAEPGVRTGSWQEFDMEAPAGRLHLSSLPGVFAAGKLDEGSALLLPVLGEAKGRRTLDLGCGYGLLGLLAAQAGASQVDLVDESLLAVASAEKNLVDHQAVQARAFASDALSDVLDRRYDLVVTNPPFHSGKAVDYRMTEAFIRGSWDVLEPGGKLLLVANRFIPYERLIKEVFGTLQTLAETGRYQVLQAEK